MASIHFITIIIPEVYDIEPQQVNSHHSGYGQPHHYEYARPQDRRMYNPNNPMRYQGSNYAGSDYGEGGYPM